MKTAWRRDNLWISLSSAPSIEETGLDFSLYGEYLSPHETLRKTSSATAETSAGILRALSMPGRATELTKRDEPHDDRPESTGKDETKVRNGRLERKLSVNGRFSDQISVNGGQVGGEQISVYGGQVGAKRKDARGPRKLANGSNAGRSQSLVRGDDRIAGSLGKWSHRDQEIHPPEKLESALPSSNVHGRGRPGGRSRRSSAVGASSNQSPAADVVEDHSQLSGIQEENFTDAVDSLAAMSKVSATSLPTDADSSQNNPLISDSSAKSVEQSSLGQSGVSSLTTEKSEPDDILPKPSLDPTSNLEADNLIDNSIAGEQPLEPLETLVRSSETLVRSSNPGDSGLLQSGSSGLQARNRWRRVKHTLAFAHHMSHNVRSGPHDFLELGEREPMTSLRGDAGGAGAAAFEGARLRGKCRAKGRKGMEGMLVRQDKGMISLVQDFYVACLKMPIAHFLVGVFLAPIALGLLFTPFYLLDKGGLAFDGVTLAEETIIVSRVAAAKQKVSALVNVFLYALSLSTTFGGSPVAALSPFCLCVANVNTLMGQFLFVFLSGAVFARMSQPSHPIRCSKKAIIRTDDFTSVPSDDPKRPKVFAVRLVLTGPPPCELVDAKVCLTFRIFIKLPSGAMFCSTQDLDLVRPEVSYLRYGIMVRHIIDQKSPVYGHTMESLMDGDASFSLTIMGLERTSMQPIFHLEDYFVCDGDVAWDADYVDFIHINNEGHRVLDHSKIDLIRVTKSTKMVGMEKAESKSEGKSDRKSEEKPERKSEEKPEGKSEENPERKSEETPEADSQGNKSDPKTSKGWASSDVSRRNVWNSKSTSFTRADW